MEYNLNDTESASALTPDVMSLANNFQYATAQPDISPSLSLHSTPGLSFAETPDTNVSHDFDVTSPAFSSAYRTSGDNFGRDYPIFGTKEVDSLPMQTAFDSYKTISTPQMSPTTVAGYYADALPDHSAVSISKSDNSEVFVTPTDLMLGTGALSGIPPSPSHTVHDDFSYESQAPVSITRTNSDSSVFAVPKLPRGRKRKSSVDSTIDGGNQLSGQSSSLGTAVDEDDEKVKLRAKNTESAARSRLRKKMELACAQQRIAELEEAARLSALRSDIAQKRIAELEHQLALLASELADRDTLAPTFQL